LLPETMIDSYVKLVLIVRFVAEPFEVVGEPRRSGLGVAVEQRSCGGIEGIGNDISGVGVMVRRPENHVLFCLNAAAVRIRNHNGYVRSAIWRVLVRRYDSIGSRRPIEKLSENRRKISSSLRDCGNR